MAATWTTNTDAGHRTYCSGCGFSIQEGDRMAMEQGLSTRPPIRYCTRCKPEPACENCKQEPRAENSRVCERCAGIYAREQQRQDDLLR